MATVGSHITQLVADKAAGTETTTYGSCSDGKWSVGGGLTMVDPMYQVARRIEAFFKDDKDVVVSFYENTDADITAPVVDEDGHVTTVGQDHLAEVNIYVQGISDDVTDTTKAECISNWIRHQHVFPEYNIFGELLRTHRLYVHVWAVGSADANIEGKTIADRVSECSFIVDESQQSGLGNTERWDQKFEELQIAFKNNPNIVKFDEFESEETTAHFRFIECSNKPVWFQEDNLTNLRGYHSELAETVLNLVFVFDGDFQISTYVNPYKS